MELEINCASALLDMSRKSSIVTLMSKDGIFSTIAYFPLGPQRFFIWIMDKPQASACTFSPSYITEPCAIYMVDSTSWMLGAKLVDYDIYLILVGTEEAVIDAWFTNCNEERYQLEIIGQEAISSF